MVDVVFSIYAVGYVIGSLPPKNYSIIPSMGFALPDTKDGYYDVAVMLNLTTPFFAGYQFTQGTPINVNVTTIVYNSDFNSTSNSLYFTFQSAEIWNSSSPHPGCETVIRPPLGVNLTEFTHPTTINGKLQNAVYWHGSQNLCFLNQGNFEAIFTVQEPNKSPIVLRQNAGNISQIYSLPVEPPNTVQQYFFDKANIFLGFSLLLLEIIGSGALMLELWRWAFPDRPLM